MLKIPKSLTRPVFLTLLFAILMGVAGCTRQDPNASNVQPGDYKKAPPLPPRPTTP